MKPIYISGVFAETKVEDILNTTPWIQVTDARLECFMSESTETYTYGSGKGIRTYTPVAYSSVVSDIQGTLNTNRPPIGNTWSEYDLNEGYRNEPRFDYNVCFLNRYDNSQMQLGWHSDDSPGMNHAHPIAVVSFGQAREIWWREIDQKGVIPADQRQLLEHGSVFIMPAGMQRTHQHRIPKGDRVMQTRVSLTFRNYVPSKHPKRCPVCDDGACETKSLECGK